MTAGDRPTNLNPEGLGPARGFSHVTVAGGMVWVAGQIGSDDSGALVEPADVVAQFGRAIRNVAAALEAAGCKPEDTVKLTYYVTDIPIYKQNLTAIGAAYRGVFGRHYPATTLVEVSSLFEPDAKVEIEAVAVQPEVKRWEHFEYDESGGVATLTFSRPERLNSLTFDVYADIRELTQSLRERKDVRVLVLRGKGRGFCSGGDVDEIIAELLKKGTRDVYEFARMTGACVRNLRELPQPVIAGVNGVAAGAGAVLATASDLRVLAESASFRFLFTSVGLSGGDMGVCWLLPRIVGLGRATEALLLGSKIESHQALAWGLASAVVPDEKLDATVAEYAGRLKELAPWGLAMTKEMLNRAASTDYSSAIEMEAFTQTLLMTAEDFREFHAGFTEKRKPEFRGR